MLNTFKRLIGKPKYNFLAKEFKDRSFKLLDIGGGSGDSATEIMSFLPNCQYYCIDMVDTKIYKTNELGNTIQYWQKNLELLEFDDVPDDFFDAINMTHIIEHLKNGDTVIEHMTRKMKRGGFIYIEYPGFNSTKLPSMPGTLNFFDDNTHVRIYSLSELYNVLMKVNCLPLSGGYRRNLIRLIFIPLLLPYKLVKTPHRIGYEFWDLLGFANYVWARKR